MLKKIGRWLSAFLGLLPMAAFADTSGPFVVSSTDVSVKILSQIFGGLMPDGGVDAFHGAISTFNGAVLIVGGILATYTLLAGTLGTAHDGEMLGKKFSSVWIPIRFALGTALVLPVLSGGYCIMQQIVMWCILQGVGLANGVWSSYLSTANFNLPVEMTPAHQKQVLNFAQNVALAQICVQANAAVHNSNGSAEGKIDDIIKSVNSTFYNYSVDYVTLGNYNLAWFGNNSTSAGSSARGSCGKANLTSLPAPQNIVPTSVSSGGKLGNISEAFKLGDVTPVYQAHITQSKLLITSIGLSAANAVAADKPLPASEVKLAADKYVEAVKLAANGYANGQGSPFSGIVAASQQQGWIMAGAWFTKLAMMNQSLNDAVNAIPSASATWQLGSGFKFFSSIQPKISTVRAEIIAAMNISIADNGSESTDDAKGKSTQSSENGSKIVQWVVEVFTGLNLETLQNSTKHPMLVLQDAGNRMIAAWSVATGGLMAILAITGISVLGNHWDGGPLVMTLIGFAFLPIAGLVALGFTLAYLLPNLPFLMWIGIILGWLIMCIEAILAAPLWAVMHLHPNGDDLTGRGGNGYMLLLGLLLRPALTIFGLIAALVLTELMGEFVNKIFFSVFFSGSGNGLVTILSVIFSMTVYTSAMVQLFRKTFSLMHVIPDQLMRWVGGGQEQMGQYAGGLAEAGQKGVQAAATAGTFLGERTTQSAGQAIMQMDQMKKGRAERDRRESATKSEITSQESGFAQTLGGSAGVEKMNNRTEGVQKLLDNSHPSSKEGLELRDAQSKMIKARSQGDAQTSNIPGGKEEFAQALASGEAADGKTVASMDGKTDFDREANFAAHVANGIQQKNQATQLATQAESQAASQSQSTQQLDSLRDIGSQLRNKNQNQSEFVNMATATDIQGDLFNPGLAQTIATSGTVNPAARGLTPNAANIIQHGGVITPNSSTSQGPVADINSAEGHSQPRTQDPNSAAQFTPPVNITSSTPSQSFDGSGGSGGYSSTPTNNSNDSDS